jgi:hypothetical protein
MQKLRKNQTGKTFPVSTAKDSPIREEDYPQRNGVFPESNNTTQIASG